MIKKKRTRPTLRRGTYVRLSLDPMTRDRITYATEASQRLFGVSASASTIVRAAVAHYVRLLEEEHVGKQYERRGATANWKDADWLDARGELVQANAGAIPNWPAFPTAEFQVEPLPLLSDIAQRHRKPIVPGGLPPLVGPDPSGRMLGHAGSCR